MSAERLEIDGLRLVTTHVPQGHPHAVLVDGVSLAVTRGRVTALVGASGSGKSLTCAAALGVLPRGVRRVGGAVSIDGRTFTGSELRGRLVASVLQNPRTAFNPVMTMAGHARETLAAVGDGAPIDWGRVRATMVEVGLDPERVLSLHPFEMSGGMLQRMMIALAVLSGAPFVFADEPTTDLDVVVQAQVLDLIARTVQRHRTGLLLVTHDLGVVARLADEVVVISEGRVIERGDVRRVMTSPAHPLTQSLVNSHLELYEVTA